MKRKLRKFLSLLIVVCMVFQLTPAVANAASDQITLAFGDSGITEVISGEGYSVKGTTLKIKEAGTYRITGNCERGNI